MTFRKLALVSVAALSLGAAAAFAQSAPPPAGPHPMMHRFSHADMCLDRFAHTAGRLAYLEARLGLTAEERPLFATWRSAVEAGAEKGRAFCLAHAPKPETRPTIVDRAALIEQMLTAKAETLRGQQPALAALYNALTPEQRRILDRPHRGWRHGHGEHGGGGKQWHGGPHAAPAEAPKPAQ